LLYLTVSTVVAQPISWLSPIDGDWNDPLAWSLGRVPGMPGDMPTLGLTGSYSVYSDQDAQYNSLLIENPDASLRISGAGHALTRDITNHGFIRIGDGLTPVLSSMMLSSFNTISGTGTIELAAPDSPEQSQLNALFSIMTHREGHLIRGGGEINAATLFNEGDIQSIGPVGLRVRGVISQTATGTIAAIDAPLFMGSGTSITGGTLETTGDGYIEIEGETVSYDGVVHDASTRLASGTRELELRGNIVNSGVIELDASLDQQPLMLRMSDHTQITGAGTIVLLAGDDEANAELRLPANANVYMGPDQMIAGDGFIRTLNQARLEMDGMISTVPGLGSLRLAGIIAGSGVMRANQTDVLIRGGITLQGLTLTGVDGGVFVIEQGTSTLSNCRNETEIRFGTSTATLQLRHELENNGRVLIDAIHPGMNVLVTSIGDTLISGDGEIELVSGDESMPSLTARSGSLIIGPDQKIFGHGTLDGHIQSGEFLNRGEIRASDPLRPIRLRGNHRSEGGQYVADDAQIVIESPSMLADIAFTSLGSGEYVVESSTTLDCVHNVGSTIRFATSNRESQLQGTTINDGLMLIENGARLVVAGDSSIAGIGDIRLLPGAELSIGTFSDLADPVIQQGQSIEGAGEITGSGVLGTSVVANIPDQEMVIDGFFEFEGNEIRSDGSGITFGSRTMITDAVLTGDLFKAGPACVFIDVKNESQVDIVSDGDLSWQGASRNDGTIRLTTSELDADFSILTLSEFSPVVGHGEILLDSAAGDRIDSSQIRVIVTETARITADQAVRGAGQIIGRAVIEGEIEPGGDLAQLQVSDLVLHESSTLVMTLDRSAPGGSTRLTTLPGGRVELGGTLRINIADGTHPFPGQTWQLIGAVSQFVPGEIVGAFDAVEFPHAPINLRYTIEQGLESLILVASCAPDLNGDGKLNVFDVSLFIQSYGAGDLTVDFNADAELNFFDVTAFIQAYSAGCQS
jgi:hypothetical protein